MKVLVAVKHVVDPYVKIRINAERTAVDTQSLKHTINPFDEVALEQALQLFDSGLVHEVVAISIGSVAAHETLQHALALGATRALHVHTEESYSCLHVAQILCQLVRREEADLVLFGKQSIDGDNAQTPAMLAGLLNWPQALAISSLAYIENLFVVSEQTEDGTLTLGLRLPAVVSVDLHLNQPRYATLPNLMRAQFKPIESVNLLQLGLNVAPCTQVLHVTLPPERKTGIRVDSVAELVHKLRDEVGVIE